MNTPDFQANALVTLSDFYGAANEPKDQNAFNGRESTINTDVLEDPAVTSSVQVAFEAGGLMLNGERVSVFLPENENTIQAPHENTFGWQPGESDLAEAQLAAEQQSQ